MTSTIHIDEVLCKGCALCIHFCPRGVIALADQHNEKGYVIAQVVHPEKCTACRLCEIGCPDLAIYIEKKREEVPC